MARPLRGPSELCTQTNFTRILKFGSSEFANPSIEIRQIRGGGSEFKMVCLWFFVMWMLMKWMMITVCVFDTIRFTKVSIYADRDPSTGSSSDTTKSDVHSRRTPQECFGSLFGNRGFWMSRDCANWGHRWRSGEDARTWLNCRGVRNTTRRRLISGGPVLEHVPI